MTLKKQTLMRHEASVKLGSERTAAPQNENTVSQPVGGPLMKSAPAGFVIAANVGSPTLLPECAWRSIGHFRLEPAHHSAILQASVCDRPHPSTSTTGKLTSLASAPCLISTLSALLRTAAKKCTFVPSATGSPRLDETVSP